MTAQPRDLAAEAEEIRKKTADGIELGLNGQLTLLLHIAALSRKLQELRAKYDQLCGGIRQAGSNLDAKDRALDLQREALRWVLENGVVKIIHQSHIDGQPVPRLAHSGDYDSIEPPAHLAPILAEAMRSKP